jgi:hypothetical protein
MNVGDRVYWRASFSGKLVSGRIVGDATLAGTPENFEQLWPVEPDGFENIALPIRASNILTLPEFPEGIVL